MNLSSERSTLNDPRPTDDHHVLACIEQLYAIEYGPAWSDTLELLVKAFCGRSGVVLEAIPGYRVLALAGAGFAWLDCPLLTSGTGQLGRQIALHTLQTDGRTFIWLIDGVTLPPVRSRLVSVCENLRLAIDFAVRRAEKHRLTGRLRAPSAARIAEVEALLETLNERAAACVLLAARGYTNGQISDYLQVAPGTVARSLQEAYRHLGVAGRSDLDVAALLTQPKPKSAWQLR